MKIDIESFIEANKSLDEYRYKFNKIQEKLKNLTIKGNTKYSVLKAAKENQIQTKSEDPAYNLELEAFDLRRIIEISVYVLDKQIDNFKKTVFSKYQYDIVKFRKGMVTKGMQNVDIWQKLQDIVMA